MMTRNTKGFSWIYAMALQAVYKRLIKDGIRGRCRSSFMAFKTFQILVVNRKAVGHGTLA